MAMSYYDESEAPRDFRVSTPESDDNYTKCVLCYTVKKNFYCVDCVRNGSFIHSSMPYSDSFSEKQLRLMKIKRDRQIILEKCKKLLEPKLNKDILVTETKQSRNKLDLLKLAIDQRRSIIDRKRKELTELQSYNNDIRLRLPRYQKRVLNIRKHVLEQKSELQNKISLYSDQTQSLAALRRSRIRQLIRYIFPIYMSYDLSDSIEDLEFLGDDLEEPQKRPQLHIVAPWIDINADYSHIQTWVSQSKEPAAGGEPNTNPAQRARAALGLAAQLLALLAWTLDVRLPYAIALRYHATEHEPGAAAGAARLDAGRAPAVRHRAQVPRDRTRTRRSCWRCSPGRWTCACRTPSRSGTTRPNTNPAQLLALLAWTLDVRLPYAIALRYHATEHEPGAAAGAARLDAGRAPAVRHRAQVPRDRTRTRRSCWRCSPGRWTCACRTPSRSGTTRPNTNPAQLLALLAWTLDVRLPYAIALRYHATEHEPGAAAGAARLDAGRAPAVRHRAQVPRDRTRTRRSCWRCSPGRWTCACRTPSRSGTTRPNTNPAQLLALLAWTLDVRLPYAIALRYHATEHEPGAAAGAARLDAGRAPAVRHRAQVPRDRTRTRRSCWRCSPGRWTCACRTPSRSGTTRPNTNPAQLLALLAWTLDVRLPYAIALRYHATEHEPGAAAGAARLDAGRAPAVRHRAQVPRDRTRTRRSCWRCSPGRWTCACRTPSRSGTTRPNTNPAQLLALLAWTLDVRLPYAIALRYHATEHEPGAAAGAARLDAGRAPAVRHRAQVPRDRTRTRRSCWRCSPGRWTCACRTPSRSGTTRPNTNPAQLLALLAWTLDVRLPYAIALRYHATEHEPGAAAGAARLDAGRAPAVRHRAQVPRDRTRTRRSCWRCSPGRWTCACRTPSRSGTTRPNTNPAQLLALLAWTLDVRLPYAIALRYHATEHEPGAAAGAARLDAGRAPAVRHRAQVPRDRTRTRRSCWRCSPGRWTCACRTPSRSGTTRPNTNPAQLLALLAWTLDVRLPYAIALRYHATEHEPGAAAGAARLDAGRAPAVRHRAQVPRDRTRTRRSCWRCSPGRWTCACRTPSRSGTTRPNTNPAQLLALLAWTLDVRLPYAIALRYHATEHEPGAAAGAARLDAGRAPAVRHRAQVPRDRTRTRRSCWRCSPGRWTCACRTPSRSGTTRPNTNPAQLLALLAWTLDVRLPYAIALRYHATEHEPGAAAGAARLDAGRAPAVRHRAQVPRDRTRTRRSCWRCSPGRWTCACRTPSRSGTTRPNTNPAQLLALLAWTLDVRLPYAIALRYHATEHEPGAAAGAARLDAGRAPAVRHRAQVPRDRTRTRRSCWRCSPGRWTCACRTPSRSGTTRPNTNPAQLLALLAWTLDVRLPYAIALRYHATEHEPGAAAGAARLDAGRAPAVRHRAQVPRDRTRTRRSCWRCSPGRWTCACRTPSRSGTTRPNTNPAQLLALLAWTLDVRLPYAIALRYHATEHEPGAAAGAARLDAGRAPAVRHRAQVPRDRTRTRRSCWRCSPGRWTCACRTPSRSGTTRPNTNPAQLLALLAWTLDVRLPYAIALRYHATEHEPGAAAGAARLDAGRAPAVRHRAQVPRDRTRTRRSCWRCSPGRWTCACRTPSRSGTTRPNTNPAQLLALLAWTLDVRLPYAIALRYHATEHEPGAAAGAARLDAGRAPAVRHRAQVPRDRTRTRRSCWRCSPGRWTCACRTPSRSGTTRPNTNPAQLLALLAWTLDVRLPYAIALRYHATEHEPGAAAGAARLDAGRAPAVRHRAQVPRDRTRTRRSCWRCSPGRWTCACRTPSRSGTTRPNTNPAQLLALLAWTLDVRLPYAIALRYHATEHEPGAAAGAARLDAGRAPAVRHRAQVPRDRTRTRRSCWRCSPGRWTCACRTPSRSGTTRPNTNPAQLLALLAWTLDVRLPYAIALRYHATEHEPGAAAGAARLDAGRAPAVRHRAQVPRDRTRTRRSCWRCSPGRWTCACRTPSRSGTTRPNTNPAQLLALLAWTLDVRLPYAIALRYHATEHEPGAAAGAARLDAGRAPAVRHRAQVPRDRTRTRRSCWRCSPGRWTCACRTPSRSGTTRPNTNPAQLLALLAWTLDVRLPYAIALSEYSDPRSWRSCVVRVRAGAAALCARAGVAPLPELCPAPAPSSAPAPAPAPLAALSALHALSLAAAADDPELGRVETWSSDNWDAYEMWLAGDDLDEPEPPEHLHWPDTAQISELSCTPPPAPSLVTSAAASFASLWRGWTK
ncbi:unnamed protein product [Euphydryas editha]|uniref:Beclin 1-associated autophagy-related key regulator n=1 Tax=Euphydryas editha TaxID=104508 RepID=A0AAU9V5X4_EUPED|nr:unnamed protein product [Euphydryas editha]